ncbi:MAG: DUF4189 domain-containing protein [Actinomycetia bacterium]|nr:DUF4189 domain-containing protein [Actinomycetes bacterium]
MLVRIVVFFAVVSAIAAAGLAAEPAAWARPASGWTAVAHSPSRESLDWNININQQAAEATALRQCAVLQSAENCRILASGPSCVAVAWDIGQPLNRPYGAAADTPAAALQSAISLAGPFANDPTVHCSYLSQEQPAGSARGGRQSQMV